jgi:hypothetical protein
MKTNFVIILVAIIVAAGVGYYAYGVGKTEGAAQAAAVRSSFFGDQQRFPAQTGGRGAGGQAQGNPGAAAFFAGLQGTVDKIDGNTLTVTVQRGNQTQTVKVTLSDTTAVQEFAAGTLTDVKSGSHILIGIDRQAGAGGQAQGGGTAGQLPSELTARTITVLPANFTQ